MQTMLKTFLVIAALAVSTIANSAVPIEQCSRTLESRRGGMIPITSKSGRDLRERCSNGETCQIKLKITISEMGKVTDSEVMEVTPDTKIARGYLGMASTRSIRKAKFLEGPEQTCFVIDTYK